MQNKDNDTMENKKGVQSIEFKFKSVSLIKPTLATRWKHTLEGYGWSLRNMDIFKIHLNPFCPISEGDTKDLIVVSVFVTWMLFIGVQHIKLFILSDFVIWKLEDVDTTQFLTIWD